MFWLQCGVTAADIGLVSLLKKRYLRGSDRAYTATEKFTHNNNTVADIVQLAQMLSIATIFIVSVGKFEKHLNVALARW